MKRNLRDAKNDALRALMAAIVWAPPPAPGMAVAAFIDDGSWDENDLKMQLADTERSKVGQLLDPVERRHFILRRCFQRVFLKTVLNREGALPDLRIEHHVDTQPLCLDAPLYKLSFSSSGSTALACASANHLVGIDVEKVRVIGNVSQLAQRFFTADEATSISKCARDKQDLHFLHLWTAKEAGLKATGKGIVSGLNSFVVKRVNNSYAIETVVQIAGSGPWTLQYFNVLPLHVVAVVHKPDNSTPVSL